jgi:hypothetical protein
MKSRDATLTMGSICRVLPLRSACDAFQVCLGIPFTPRQDATQRPLHRRNAQARQVGIHLCPVHEFPSWAGAIYRHLSAKRRQQPLTPTFDRPRLALAPQFPMVECPGRRGRRVCQYFILPCRSSQPNSWGRRAAPGSMTALMRDALPELNERSSAGRISSGRVTYSP